MKHLVGGRLHLPWHLTMQYFEQKAQVLLEVGDAWHALTAATSILLFSPCNIYPVVL